MERLQQMVLQFHLDGIACSMPTCQSYDVAKDAKPAGSRSKIAKGQTLMNGDIITHTRVSASTLGEGCRAYGHTEQPHDDGERCPVSVG